MQDSKRFVEVLKQKKGLLVGIGIGLLVGILVLSIGFFSTLFLAICVGLGAFFGTRNRFKIKFYEILDKILPDIFK